MIFRLTEYNVDQLIRLPETGMGYQIVETTGSTYTASLLAVFNAQFAVEVRSSGFRNVLKAISGGNIVDAFMKAKQIQTNIVGVRSPFLQNLALSEPAPGTKDKGATESETEQPNGDELFVRLSAFENDRRVDKQNNCLLPGSFTTTASDALRCKTQNDNPVERYALPVDIPIEWAFYIQPSPSDLLKRGWVQPAFARQGGGREAFFEKGTANGTFIAQTKWL